jgi:hypothetical protein
VAAAEGGRDGGRETAGACVARALSGFPGGGFEFLLGPFCVPPKLTFCFQCFSPIFIYLQFRLVIWFFCLLLLFMGCFVGLDALFIVSLFVCFLVIQS